MTTNKVAPSTSSSDHVPNGCAIKETSVGPQDNYIVALFVVIFDTKRGNEVEWQYPQDVDLAGVEFKALVSGSHTINEDFVYFQHQGLFGLSCFALKHVDSADERGARMKSVGIICTSYTSLHEHQDFLDQQVRQHLDLPFNYDSLLKYYNRYRCCPEQNNFLPSPVSCTPAGVDDLAVMKITHPTGCFSQFIQFFGINIFALWRFVILQKRILFFAPLPVGIQCYRVYCAGLLGSNAFGHLRMQRENLLFYISVGWLNKLKERHDFIACTTENILQTKTDAYDLYVDVQRFHCSNNYYKSLTRINAADRVRFTRLCKYTNEQLCTGIDVTDDEKMYTRFFIEQNNRLFKVLYEVASRDERVLTAEHIQEIGLDCHADQLFLREVIELYNINISLADYKCCG